MVLNLLYLVVNGGNGYTTANGGSQIPDNAAPGVGNRVGQYHW